MSSDTPLQRAHALSAQATALLSLPASSPSTASPGSSGATAALALPNLRQALVLTREAADLFLLASSPASSSSPAISSNGPATSMPTGDDAAKRTMGLLGEQHRRQARDLERRIGALEALAQAQAQSQAKPHMDGRRASSATARPGSGSMDGADDGPSPSRIPVTHTGIPPTGTPRVRAPTRRNTSDSPLAPAHVIGGGAGASPPMSLGLAAAGLGLGHTPSPFSASGAPVGYPASPNAGFQRPLPPFARPPSTTASPYPSSSTPISPTRPSTQAPPPLSPLYSSSSSSSQSPSLSLSASHSFARPDTSESFTHLGSPPGTWGVSGVADPFSRFWGMLENMLESWNGPVVFASAPLGLEGDDPGVEGQTHRQYGQGEHGGRAGGEMGGRRVRKSAENRAEEGRRASLGRQGSEPTTRQGLGARPDESFYIVPSSNPASTAISARPLSTVTSGASPASPSAAPSAPSPAPSTSASNQPHLPTHPGNPTPTPKTPEELRLENESLRLSLDAISRHAAGVEGTNRRLLETLKEWERVRREMTMGLRREAQKVKQGQEMLRSQLIASTTTLSPARSAGPNSGPLVAEGDKGKESEEVLRLKKTVEGLEAQLKASEAEREKQKLQLDKYRDRFDKLKASAKAKKDAKAAAAVETG